jgi:hypothetical protein
MINFFAIFTILFVANLASITSFFKQLLHLFNKKIILPNSLILTHIFLVFVMSSVVGFRRSYLIVLFILFQLLFILQSVNYRYPLLALARREVAASGFTENCFRTEVLRFSPPANPVVPTVLWWYLSATLTRRLPACLAPCGRSPAQVVVPSA